LYRATAKARIQGDAERYLVLHRLFAAAMLPYLTILDGWLFHGSLSADKRSEFFIHMVPSVPAADALGVHGQHGDGKHELAAGDWRGSAASVYWHRFAIRVGGDTIQSGRILAFSSTHVQVCPFRRGKRRRCEWWCQSRSRV